MKDAVLKPGYHVTVIEKGEYGELSKIREELEELEDAKIQDSKIMMAVECADLIGAIEAFADKHLFMDLEDLIKFSRITNRAFINGHR